MWRVKPRSIFLFLFFGFVVVVAYFHTAIWQSVLSTPDSATVHPVAVRIVYTATWHRQPA
jgi:hypothetical protein